MVGRHAARPVARLALALTVAVPALGTGCRREDRALREASEHLRRNVEAAPRITGGVGDEEEVWRDLRRFYEKTRYRPAWFRGTEPRQRWDKLLVALASSRRHGLDPQTYDIAGLTQQRALSEKRMFSRETFEPELVGEIDPRLTHAFLTYASHLVRGEMDPAKVDESWVAHRRQVDFVAALEEALQTGDVLGVLDRLAPRHPGYLRLLEASASATPEQQRTMALTQERWRWMPEDLGQRYVIVNIPAYELYLIERGAEVLRMRVVVGKAFDPTPVFSDEITHVTFNPSWNVPESIAAEEILPAVSADETYLERHNMEIVDKQGQVVTLDEVDTTNPKSFLVRQRPGGGNALGRIKFVLPNKHDVYLHDTPAGSLFSRTSRAFSHGCVRVEKPFELAAALLGDAPRWSRPAIDKAVAAGEEQSVKLGAKVPVHIVYWTAWVDGGRLQIGEDVYGHDKTQMEAMLRARPWLAAPARASR